MLNLYKMKTIMKKILLCVSMAAFALAAAATESFVAFTPSARCFPLIAEGTPCPLLTDAHEDAGVAMAVETFREDIRRVCGVLPDMLRETSGRKRCVVIGSLKTPLIRELIGSGKIDGRELEGKNEKYILQTVASPYEGMDEALVIAGSDKRGTIYGIYELSKQMGVSPWYWWADVPVEPRRDVYVRPGLFTDGEPKVEYRGIFLNDEWPCLGNWAREKCGGFNSDFYRRVFELVLRLRGNFMWPAMWNSAFYDDDAANGELADAMGIVMGTSHHEPMALAQQDWKRRGKGAWDYSRNSRVLDDFWTSGIERCKNWETIVTVGMRGDGDEPMSEEANIALLEKIVRKQRRIIERVTGTKAEKTPQVWALYKEVQEYYDKGMRVPDDVTLLLCDDNWGNVRKLPDLNEPPRAGGYGMYYHFDYVGAPRNSKWMNINPIPRVWEQMNLTYQYGVRKLWVVNVGDLKPMEYPVTFFLDMAWNPERFHAGNLQQHAEDFCARQFGEAHAAEAARILSLYAKYNRRVTPELLNDSTYSFHYDEWPRVVDEYNRLELDALQLRFLLPASRLDAYDQLIAFPVQACANLYNMYYAQAQNRRLAAANRPEANRWADRVAACFERDSLLTDCYHRIAGGKWNHLMSQVHIGYTSWNNPERQTMPAVIRVPETEAVRVFREAEGYAAMEAEHYTRAVARGETAWVVIPGLGKTLSGVTVMPVTRPPDGNRLEYDVEFESEGDVEVCLLLSPTLNFNANKGLRYAVCFDGQEEQVVNFNGHYDGSLGAWQADPIIPSRTRHRLDRRGLHTLRIRPMDPGIVIQKILIDTGGLKPSYLGAPEHR